MMRAVLLAWATAATNLPRRAVSRFHPIPPSTDNPCPLDEKLSNTGIATFAYARQFLLASRRIFPWRQAQTGRKLAAVFELVRASHMRDNRLRNENRRLRMECDILKKAAAYFAKGTL